MRMLGRIADALWCPWLLGLFLLVGLVYTLGSGLFQLLGWRLWWRATAGSLFHKKERGKGGLSSLQALATALAATMGTGSIAGVAAALTLGGPGSVFWMWVSAFFGMMTSCGEKLLSVAYQRPGPDGTLRGGPMYYLRDGLDSPLLARWFCLACLPATLAGGSLVQAASMADSLEAALSLPRLPVGLAIAALAGLVMVGGLGRIARVSAALVPAMALLYLGAGAAVLVCNAGRVPAALELIVSCALDPRAALGGGAGWTVAAAMRYGVARGVFTNEAGLGTSAMAHGAAGVDHPARQGMWGIFEVFLSTLAVCTVTALAILVSGVWDPASPLTGAPLTAAAFGSALGPAGEGRWPCPCSCSPSPLSWGGATMASSAWTSSPGAGASGSIGPLSWAAPWRGRCGTTRRRCGSWWTCATPSWPCPIWPPCSCWPPGPCPCWTSGGLYQHLTSKSDGILHGQSMIR